MRNIWVFFPELNGESPYFLPADPLIYNGFGSQVFYHVTSLVNNSLFHSKHMFFPGGLALREALDCVSKFAGCMILWVSSASNSNIRSRIPDSNCSEPGRCNSLGQITLCNRLGCGFSSASKSKCLPSALISKSSRFSIWHLLKTAQKLQPLPILSLGTAMVPPFDNINSSTTGISFENADGQVKISHERPCEVERQVCADLSLPNLKWKTHAVEPRTGIQFPIILNSVLEQETNSSLSSEVLVGTGSKTMKIIKIKSLKVYAFGFYVHPYSVCEKLGAKYASIPVPELKLAPDFYQDLLREDINMTIRLVVNCSGMKISSVKDVFEKSLRARLVKTNPETDYKCLSAFGSYFKQDIPLFVGTTIDFRRTADGQLITEIEGNQIGAVCSRDLCRAFFGMYIGDGPISEQTKEEIGQNVAAIIREC